MTTALWIVCCVQFVALAVLGAMYSRERGQNRYANEWINATDRCLMELRLRHASLRNAIQQILDSQENAR